MKKLSKEEKIKLKKQVYKEFKSNPNTSLEDLGLKHGISAQTASKYISNEMKALKLTPN